MLQGRWSKRWGWALGLVAGIPWAAQAVQISQVTPQGAVNEVQQVVVQMSAEAERLAETIRELEELARQRDNAPAGDDDDDSDDHADDDPGGEDDD